MTLENCKSQIVKNKLGLINLAQELNNISRACKLMGVSRDTFYRYKEAQEQGGLEGLLEKSRRAPNLKNRVDAPIEQAVLKMAFDFPAYGQKRASNELKRSGVSLSPAGVRSVWMRNNLETFLKRLKNVEEVMAKQGGIFTEAQMRALEKKQEAKEACGEIETHHPGYLVSQDTFYVGTLKGVGRIYQQTVVDTYSKVAFAKLYNMKTAITAADALNDKVMPFFESQQVPVLRMLTDRGTEFCGKPEDHEYQLYLLINDIDHSKTKARHPQTNGICERFHKTILEEFYQVAFRKKIYKTMDELQLDLDSYMQEFNCQRTHQGKHCLGRTPMETFVEGKKKWQEKNLTQQYKGGLDESVKLN